MKKIKFTREGKTLVVSDPAHIDCLKAKGWTSDDVGDDKKIDAADDEKGKK